MPTTSNEAAIMPGMAVLKEHTRILATETSQGFWHQFLIIYLTLYRPGPKTPLWGFVFFVTHFMW